MRHLRAVLAATVLATYVPAALVTGFALVGVPGTAHAVSLAWIDGRVGISLSHAEHHAHGHAAGDLLLGAKHGGGFDDADHRVSFADDAQLSTVSANRSVDPSGSAVASTSVPWSIVPVPVDGLLRPPRLEGDSPPATPPISTIVLRI